MALYRWRKSTVSLKETTQTISAGTDVGALVGIAKVTGFYGTGGTKPSVNSNNKYTFSSSDYSTDINTQWVNVGYLGFSQETDTVFYVSKYTNFTRNGRASTGYTYTADKDLTMYKYGEVVGQFIEYVYSENVDDYPNGGSSGGYYYDSREKLNLGCYVGVNGTARKVKKIYVGITNFTPRTLPSGYTQVECIKSSGTQYVDTGFMPNQNTRVVMDIESVASHGDVPLFGARVAYQNTAFSMWLRDTKIQTDYNAASTVITVETTRKRFIIDKNKNVTTADGVTVTQTASTFQSAYSAYLFGLNQAGALNTSGTVSIKLYSCQIYDNGTLVRDFVPCVNDSGEVGLYDLSTKAFFGNAGTGVFIAGDTAKSVVHKVKRGYVGVGGVARPFWAGLTLTYYGTATGLSTTRSVVAATTVGNYALFGGGGSRSAVVDAYDNKIVRTTHSLSASKENHGATTIGNYALFGGGYDNNYSEVATVDAFNSSLTRTAPTVLSAARAELHAAANENYAIFGGGYSTGVVDAYNKSLTRSVPSALSVTRRDYRATSVGKYVLFAGGASQNVVDAYDTSLTRTTPTTLSVVMRYGAATSIGDYALFGGGHDSSQNELNVVNAYNKSLTRTIITSLSVARYMLAATTLGENALFAGGMSSWGKHDTVDKYNPSLTRTTTTSLNTQRSHLAATTVGDYALFAGGLIAGDSKSAVVDAYVLA